MSITKGSAVPQYQIVSFADGQARPADAIQLDGPPASLLFPRPAGDYLVRVENAISNGDLVSAIEDATSITVTGSSMGGHLAMAFAGIFGDQVEQAVAFNAPGFPDNAYVRNLFTGLGGVIPRVNDAKIVNVVSNEEPDPADSFNFIAGFPFGNFPGRKLNIPIEDQTFSDVPDPKTSSGNHDQRQVTDALTVFRLLQQLDTSLTLDRFGAMMRQSASSIRIRGKQKPGESG